MKLSVFFIIVIFININLIYGQNNDSLANNFVENKLYQNKKNKIKKMCYKNTNIKIVNNDIPFKYYNFFLNDFILDKDSFYFRILKIKRNKYDTMKISSKLIDSLRQNDTFMNRLHHEIIKTINKKIFYFKKISSNFFIYYNEPSTNFYTYFRMGKVTILQIYIDEYKKVHYFYNIIYLN